MVPDLLYGDPYTDDPARPFWVWIMAHSPVRVSFFDHGASRLFDLSITFHSVKENVHDEKKNLSLFQCNFLRKIQYCKKKKKIDC